VDMTIEKNTFPDSSRYYRAVSAKMLPSCDETRSEEVNYNGRGLDSYVEGVSSTIEHCTWLNKSQPAHNSRFSKLPQPVELSTMKSPPLSRKRRLCYPG